MASSCCCCQGGTSRRQCKRISAGMFVRFLYLCYTVLTIVVRTVALKKHKDMAEWRNRLKIGLLAAGIPLMIAEALFISIKRKGKEWKWFTPNIVFFLIAALPSLIDLQWNLTKHGNCPGNNPTGSKNQQTTTTKTETTTAEHVLGFKTDEWTTLLIQIAVILLVIGKWIAPKGGLTKSEHAQLLFVLLCAGADLVDFIGIEFKGTEPDVGCLIRHLVMGVGAWSSIQFCFVPTAVKKIRIVDDENSDVQSRISAVSEYGKRGPEKKAAPRYEARSCCIGNFFCFYNDIWGMLLSVMFVDLPFLAMRLLLMFKHYIEVNNSNAFFIFKNALTILITINRVWVITKYEYRPWKQQMREIRRQSNRV